MWVNLNLEIFSFGSEQRKKYISHVFVFRSIQGYARTKIFMHIHPCRFIDKLK